MRSKEPRMSELGRVTAVHHLQISLEEELGLAGPEVRIRTNKCKLQGNGYRLGWRSLFFQSSLWEHLFQRGSHQETH